MLFSRVVGCGSYVLFLQLVGDRLEERQQIELSDDVNAITLNDKLTLSAVADDSGHVTIVDVESKKVVKVQWISNSILLSVQSLKFSYRNITL